MPKLVVFYTDTPELAADPKPESRSDRGRMLSDPYAEEYVHRSYIAALCAVCELFVSCVNVCVYGVSVVV